MTLNFEPRKITDLNKVKVVFRDEGGNFHKVSLQEISFGGLPTDLSSGEDMEMVGAEVED
jgi:hypothetical protein